MNNSFHKNKNTLFLIVFVLLFCAHAAFSQKDSIPTTFVSHTAKSNEPKATKASSSYSLLHADDVYKVNSDLLIFFNRYSNEKAYTFGNMLTPCAGEDGIDMHHDVVDYELDTASFKLIGDSLFLSGIYAWHWTRTYKDTFPNCGNKGDVEKEDVEIYKFKALFTKEENYWFINYIKAPTAWSKEHFFYPKS